MKNVVRIVLFLLFVLAANLQDAEGKKMTFDEIKELLEPVKKQCVQRVGVDPKLIADAAQGIFAEDPALKCYYKCLLVMAKFMKNNRIVEKALIQAVNLMLVDEAAKPVKAAIVRCKSVNDRQDIAGCELAFELVKCSYKIDPSAPLYQ